MNPTRSILQHLIAKGVIDSQAASKVEVEKTKTSETEEQIIKRLALADEKTLIKAKSEIFNIPYVDLTGLDIPERALSEINIESLRKYSAVPFSHEDTLVKVAMQDPFDVQAIQALETKYPAGTKLEIYISDEMGINSVLDRRIGENMSSEVTDALEDVQVPVADITEEVGDEYAGNMEGMDLKSAPIARIVNSILQYGVKTSSSDIHIEPMENRLRVRFRINGMMTERLSLPKHLASSVVSRLKILSRLKIDEKRVPLDGRLQLKIADKKIDVRVSTLPSIYGEKIVMRLLENDLEHISLDTTGLRGAAYKNLLDAMSVTNGIILVTGPTGSGKTRTLAGALIRLNDPKVNIITLEDPVEIRVPGVTQVQVKAEVGLTFATGLRSVLRQDPDIVMVGEIRDQETAQLAVQASLTGHLVLSTLHTNSSSAAIPRLLDMGVEAFLLASTLRCVVAQRLPRRVCKHCVEAYPASPELMKNIQTNLAGIQNFDIVNYARKIAEISKTKEGDERALKAPDKDPSGNDQIYLYKGKGCDRCGDTGYKGRVGIFEVLPVTDKLGRLMMENVLTQDVEKAAREEGMITMLQDGYLKAIEGITTIEEVLRVSKD